MGHTLLVFLTSRWTEAAVLLLWVVALATRQRWLVFVAMVLAAAVVAALIGVFIAKQYRRHNAGTQFPASAADPEQAPKGTSEPDKNIENKNEIPQ